MPRIDLKKDLKELYQASAKEVTLVEVPPMRFLMVDGAGDPNSSPAYCQAVEALFSVSYTAKFMVKKRAESIDYSVMPLEGLWWAEDMSAFATGEKSKWQWTMMIMQPPFVEDDVIRQALSEVKAKKELPAIGLLRLETFSEGRCAQLLHVGPFTEEGPTVQRLHTYIQERGAMTGKHHEIYLSDIRRAEPAKWKTVLRQPMT